MGRLRTGHIVGVVDSQGAVHSTFTTNTKFHDELYPEVVHNRWRWNFDQGIYWIESSSRVDIEVLDAIQRHLTKKYNIYWWENGFHDLDRLNADIKRERLQGSGPVPPNRPTNSPPRK
jgi:hypothetical protein